MPFLIAVAATAAAAVLPNTPLAAYAWSVAKMKMEWIDLVSYLPPSPQTSEIYYFKYTLR